MILAQESGMARNLKNKCYPLSLLAYPCFFFKKFHPIWSSRNQRALLNRRNIFLKKNRILKKKIKFWTKQSNFFSLYYSQGTPWGLSAKPQLTIYIYIYIQRWAKAKLHVFYRYTGCPSKLDSLETTCRSSLYFHSHVRTKCVQKKFARQKIVSQRSCLSILYINTINVSVCVNCTL